MLTIIITSFAHFLELLPQLRVFGSTSQTCAAHTNFAS
jgi:hypothetical protein